MHVGFWRGNQKESNNLEDPDVVGEDDVKIDLEGVGCYGLD
jgi:hypothetical protein